MSSDEDSEGDKYQLVTEVKKEKNLTGKFLMTKTLKSKEVQKKRISGRENKLATRGPGAAKRLRSRDSYNIMFVLSRQLPLISDLVFFFWYIYQPNQLILLVDPLMNSQHPS
jgi:hypothetical protein